MTQTDPFEPLDYGGFTVDYSGTVTSVEFRPGQYNFEAVLTFRRDEPTTNNDGTVRTEEVAFYTIGGTAQWESPDGGRTFRGTTKPDAKVRSNSGYGELVQRVTVEMTDCRAALIAAGKTDYKSADFWTGLRFHVVTEGAGKPYAFKDDSGVERTGTTKGRPMPVEFLGIEGVAGSTPNGAPTPAFDLASLALPDDVLTQLRDAAASTDTFGDAFIGKALTIDGVMGNTKLVDALGPGLYAALRG